MRVAVFSVLRPLTALATSRSASMSSPAAIVFLEVHRCLSMGLEPEPTRALATRTARHPAAAVHQVSDGHLEDIASQDDPQTPQLDSTTSLQCRKTPGGHTSLNFKP